MPDAGDRDAVMDRRGLEFSPPLLAVRDRPPSPLPRTMMMLAVALFFIAIAWAALARIDIVAVADGKLVPESQVKIVQPAEAGILREILVREGETVSEGQVLMRLDPQLAKADLSIIERSLALHSLQLRRIDAQLAGEALVQHPEDDEALFAQQRAKKLAGEKVHADELAAEQAELDRYERDRDTALQVQRKLAALLPSYEEESRALAKLGARNLAARMDVLAGERERIGMEQDLQAQGSAVAAAQALVERTRQRIEQIESSYRDALRRERTSLQAEYDRLERERDKQVHRNSLLALRAPTDGIIRDVATYTNGAVISPGTVLMSLVPHNEALAAEVYVNNADVGFVHEGQRARLKVATYRFQKYGLVDAKVLRVGIDAVDETSTDGKQQDSRPNTLAYKATLWTCRGLVDTSDRATMPWRGDP